jgi:membrane protease YdiL (CAAX protease family)
VWWQTALIVFALIILAPLGEEILFRALELRGLVRLIPFAIAAPISGLLFTAAHYDAWVAWPRTLALVATGWALAWLYRWRGIPATITAHATVNTVAAIALIVQA